MVGYFHNIFMEHDLNILMIFGMKKELIILTHNVLLVISTNIPCAPVSHKFLVPSIAMAQRALRL